MVKEEAKAELPQLSEKGKAQIYSFAYNLYESGKYAEAAQSFQLLTLTDTYKKRNWMGLGAAHQMDGEYAKAVQAFGFAAVLDQDDPYTHLHAAECFFSLEMHFEGKQALESAETVAKSDSKYVNVLSRIALLHEAWCKDGEI